MSESVSLTVRGMKCGGCESNVTNKLQEVDGVLSVSAANKEDLVDLEFDTEKTTLNELIQVISDAGFTVE